MSAPVGLGGELGEQARLADAGLTHELDGRRAALPELGDESVDRPKLGGTPDELLSNGHVVSGEHR
jgi:hypothetical protein